jgi:flagellar biosynthesis protein FlhF
MKVKSYFASSVEGAMTMAAGELGEDALLVYSRESTPETRYLGRYEVVFAVADGKLQPAGESVGSTASEVIEVPLPVRLEKTPDAAARAIEGVGLTELSTQLLGLRAQIERLERRVRDRSVGDPDLDLRRVADRGTPEEPDDDRQRTLTLLLAADVPFDLAEAVVTACRFRSGTMEARVGAELARRLKTGRKLSRTDGGSGIVLLVGPPGVGKTTAVAKLAGQRLLEGLELPLLVSFDPHGVAGCEPLRTYASVLGADFLAVDDVRVLPMVIEGNESRDLVLIDSPGYSHAELDRTDALAEWAASTTGVDVLLALSASMRSSDLSRVVERFERFRPSKLLFARLDETTTYGALWATAARSEKPVAFLSAGRRIPEDLAEAKAEAIADLIVGPIPGHGLGDPAAGTAPSR